jgi:hypothetical protein
LFGFSKNSIFKDPFKSISLKRAYGKGFCLSFSKNRCKQEMLIDQDLFEDEKEFLQYIKSVQEYGVQNLALLKVCMENFYSVFSGFRFSSKIPTTLRSYESAP